jgi:uncharacterized membrane protein (Fun14 family)
VRVGIIKGEGMANTIAQSGTSFLDTVSQKLHLDSLMNKFNISKSTLIEIGLHLGVGFAVGFLLKRYNKLFFTLVLLFLGLWFFQHIGVINLVINWAKIQELFGLQCPFGQSSCDLGTAVWQWITTHVAATISLLLGFLIGIRLA